MYIPLNLRVLAINALLLLSTFASVSSRGFIVAPRASSDRDVSVAEAGLVHQLPGWKKPLDTKMYSGYIIVNETAGRAFFYVFVESLNTSSAAPLVWWLNGGPGCSTIGNGFMAENGPFYLKPKGILQRNKYSWHRVAHMLYVDSPAFVGWSYSNTSADNTTGDVQTALDNLTFLRKFYKRFPEYASNSLWLSGESYAGHYVPQLAQVILKHNQHSEPKINLKGFLIGNPLIDDYTYVLGQWEFYKGLLYLSEATYDQLMKHCRRSTPGAPDYKGPDSSKCKMIKEQFAAEVGHHFLYNAAEFDCGFPFNDTDGSLRRSYVKTFNKVTAKMRVTPLYTGPINMPYGCESAEVTTYLNRRDVQVALHANQSGDAVPYPWMMCASDFGVELLNYTYDNDVKPLMQHLMDKGLRMLVYCGDLDADLPCAGTRMWLAQLHSTTPPGSYKPWYSTAFNQLAGHTQDYGSLTFASVRGAGHMVPYYQPERALHMFSQFIHGLPL